MAFTTSYALLHINANALGTARANIDSVGLANGGFVGFGDRSGQLATTFFDATGEKVGSSIDLVGARGSIDLLSNGNIVIASQFAGAINFRVLTEAGASVISQTPIGDADTYDADVTAVGAGFWIAYTDEKGAAEGDADIEIVRYNVNGIQQGAAITVEGSTERDTAAAIAELDGGNVAVAWTRTLAGGDTEIWSAVYDGDGGVVNAAHIVDTDGAQNKDVSITAIDGGGFALAYEDSAWGADTDITMRTFSSSGAALETFNINDPTGAGDSANNAHASITRLTNGVLAISYDHAVSGGTHAAVRLYDPVTDAIVFGGDVTGPRPLGHNVFNSVATAFSENRLVVGGVDSTAGDVVGDAWQLVRDWEGDGAADVMNGDSLIDRMNGGGGADTLNGGGGLDLLDGGSGADTMSGGDGDDTYFVDSAGDVTTESLPTGGFDTVRSSVSRTLGIFFENLVLLGSDAINGTGNGAANAITGNSAINRLKGGASNDVLTGGGAADQLIGDSGSDTASYATSGARVRVNLNTGIGLDADAQGDTYTSIERLTGSNFNDTLTGSSVGNALKGGKGVDIIDGRGGQDFLFGGGGDDIFVFSSGLGAADTIDDFSVGNDKIRLENGIFTGLANGALAASAFHVGAAAADADDRIIYDNNTGFLYFDRDGTGVQTAIHFAVLDAGLALSHTDFTVI